MEKSITNRKNMMMADQGNWRATTRNPVEALRYE
jgi:hypothetical protein